MGIGCQVTGLSVTQRIRGVKGVAPPYPQPRGGLLRCSDMEERAFPDGAEPIGREGESVAPALIGLVVDYMSRLQSGADVREAFAVSVRGALLDGVPESEVDRMLEGIRGVDDRSLAVACNLAAYDVVVRAGGHLGQGKAVVPNGVDCEHMRKMLERTKAFFKEFGPVVRNGFTLEGGYTDVVDKGDGDFLTGDCLWDMKVLSRKPDKNMTLQLLVYWRMGLRSVYPEFQDVTRLGIYNPRLGKVYTVSTGQVPTEVIREVDEEVIGYASPAPDDARRCPAPSNLKGRVMVCPECNSSDVVVSASATEKVRPRHGVLYWLLVGWWLHPLLWLCATVPMLVWRVIRPNRKTETVLCSHAACQRCGHTWVL